MLYEYEGGLDDIDDDIEDTDDDMDGDEPDGEEPSEDADKSDKSEKDKADKPEKADKTDKTDKVEKDEEVASSWAIRTELTSAILGEPPKRASFKNDSDYINAVESRREHADWIRGVADALTKPIVYKGVTIPPLAAAESKKAIEDAKAIMTNITPERMAVLLRMDAALRSAKAEGAKTVTPAAAAPERPKAEKPNKTPRGKKDEGGTSAGGTGTGKSKVSFNDHEARARMMFGPRFDKPFDPR